MATLRRIDSVRQYPEDRTYRPIAALGLMAVMASLAAGAVVGLYAGDFWTQNAAARAADHVRRGVMSATGAWNPALLLFGISLLMTTVVVVLRRIVKTIGARGEAMSTYLPALLAPTTKPKGRR